MVNKVREFGTAEYSAMDVENPFDDIIPRRVENIADRYVLLHPEQSIKVRNEKLVKSKRHIFQDPSGIDVFINTIFPNRPGREPLKSFTKMHGIEDAFRQTDSGILVRKEKKVYKAGDVNIHCSLMKMDDHQFAILSLVGDSPDKVSEVRDKLGLTQKNLNLPGYLMGYAQETKDCGAGHCIRL